MGCGASQVDPTASNVDEKAILKQKFDIDNNEKSVPNQNGNIANGNAGQNGHLPQNKTTANNHKNSLLPPPLPAPKGVAFEVSLGGGESEIDKILNKRPPKRLQHLEPLSHLPKLTAEELEKKMQKAEEKRKKKLENKKRKAKKSSKLRNDIAKAKEFETVQAQKSIAEERQRIAEENRLEKQRILEEKKRLQEERRRKAKERAAQMKKQEGAEDVDFEVEKDENFNKDDDVDSWLDGDNNNKDGRLGDRIYSGGRESPHKKMMDGTGDIHRRAITSASTTDSFDYAFQRKPAAGLVSIEANSKAPDEFFDS